MRWLTWDAECIERVPQKVSEAGKWRFLFHLGGPTNVVRLIMTRRKARLDT